MKQSRRHNAKTEFVQFKRLLKAFLFGETAAHYSDFLFIMHRV